MRRQVVSAVFAALVCVASTAGAGPSVEGEEMAVSAAPTVAVQRVAVDAPALRDELTMVLVGTALIGLAAAVRRAG